MYPRGSLRYKPRLAADERPPAVISSGQAPFDRKQCSTERFQADFFATDN